MQFATTTQISGDPLVFLWVTQKESATRSSPSPATLFLMQIHLKWKTNSLVIETHTSDETNKHWNKGTVTTSYLT